MGDLAGRGEGTAMGPGGWLYPLALAGLGGISAFLWIERRETKWSLWAFMSLRLLRSLVPGFRSHEAWRPVLGPLSVGVNRSVWAARALGQAAQDGHAKETPVGLPGKGQVLVASKTRNPSFPFPRLSSLPALQEFPLGAVWSGAADDTSEGQ